MSENQTKIQLYYKPVADQLTIHFGNGKTDLEKKS